MMTKKDFISLGDAVRSARPPETAPHLELAAWLNLRDRVAGVCERSNLLFKRERWMDYTMGKCGPNGGKIAGGR